MLGKRHLLVLWLHVFAFTTKNFIVAWSTILVFNWNIKLREDTSEKKIVTSINQAGQSYSTEQRYSNGPKSCMKQCLFKDDHHPIRTTRVSLSIVHLAILSENIHYSKALGFVVYKKKATVPSLIFCLFQNADMQVKSKNLHSLLISYRILL